MLLEGSTYLLPTCRMASCHPHKKERARNRSEVSVRETALYIYIERLKWTKGTKTFSSTY